MPMMNGAALLIGLAGRGGDLGLPPRRRFGNDSAIIALLVASALIPLTALVGPQADGVARWLVVGGLTIQPALIVVPLIASGWRCVPR